MKYKKKSGECADLLCFSREFSGQCGCKIPSEFTLIALCQALGFSEAAASEARQYRLELGDGCSAGLLFPKE